MRGSGLRLHRFQGGEEEHESKQQDALTRELLPCLVVDVVFLGCELAGLGMEKPQFYTLQPGKHLPPCGLPRPHSMPLEKERKARH